MTKSLITQTVTLAPGQAYEISLAVPPGAANLTVNAGLPDAFTLAAGDTAIIRVRCIEPGKTQAVALPMPPIPPPVLESAA